MENEAIWQVYYLRRFPMFKDNDVSLLLDHRRATFYSTTWAPVWSSANRVWFCSEWRAARRDATHVTLATPKARDPAHLSTCTLHVSLAFSPTFSPSRLFLLFSSLLFWPNFPSSLALQSLLCLQETSESGAHRVQSGRFFTSTATNSFSLLTHPAKNRGVGCGKSEERKNKRDRLVRRSSWLSSSLPWHEGTFSKFFGETFIFDFSFPLHSRKKMCSLPPFVALENVIIITLA